MTMWKSRRLSQLGMSASLTALMLGGVLTLTACNISGPKDPNYPAVTLFDDVPVPEGWEFKENDPRNIREESPGFRFAKYIYTWRYNTRKPEKPAWTLAQTKDFYERAAADKGWKFHGEEPGAAAEGLKWKGRWLKGEEKREEKLIVAYFEKVDAQNSDDVTCTLELHLNPPK